MPVPPEQSYLPLYHLTFLFHFNAFPPRERPQDFPRRHASRTLNG